MATEQQWNHPNEKKEKAASFVKEHLREDILDPKNLPLREAAVNWSISILRLFIVAFNVIYSTVQLIFAAMLALGDLIARGLQKAMPSPKVIER